MKGINRFIFLAVFFVGGCQSANTPEVHDMALQAEGKTLFKEETPLKGEVNPGEIEADEEREIFNERTKTTLMDFNSAISESLRMAQLLAEEGKGKYRLDTSFIKVDFHNQLFQARADRKVTSIVSYTLLRESDGQELFHRVIISSATAGVKDRKFAEDRLALAFHRAFRKNLAELVEHLYTLEIKAKY